MIPACTINGFRRFWEKSSCGVARKTRASVMVRFCFSKVWHRVTIKIPSKVKPRVFRYRKRREGSERAPVLIAFCWLCHVTFRVLQNKRTDKIGQVRSSKQSQQQYLHMAERSCHRTEHSRTLCALFFGRLINKFKCRFTIKMNKLKCRFTINCPWKDRQLHAIISNSSYVES